MCRPRLDRRKPPKVSTEFDPTGLLVQVHRHAERMEQVTRAILETPGDTDPELRKAVESFAAALSGRDDGAGTANLPDDLVPYLEKVARHAYKVTDSDVDRLKQVGYSEDAIFELTLAAALGAARARLERGLQAMGIAS